MAKPIIKPNARANQLLDDLEQFLDFCREYGYRYNEADLYNFKSYAYQQYNKFANGKNAKDMWIQDNRRG
jgi:hypothetical protein